MPRRKPADAAPRSKSEVLGQLGAHLRRLRLERAITQEALAERSTLNYKHIGRIESGKAEPGALVLIRLARALRVPVGELFDPITPTNGTGYRVSPLDVESAAEALATLDAIVGRVKSGQAGPMPVRAPRRRRK